MRITKLAILSQKYIIQKYKIEINYYPKVESVVNKKC